MLECIPAPIAGEITSRVTIPTIGIGAGPGCDGQVLVMNDLLGLTSGYVPRFVKAYADLESDDPGRPSTRYSATTCASGHVSRTAQPFVQIGRQSMPNRLAEETSPYLLQHANNPVDWHPWGPEALERPGARTSRSFFRSAIRPATGAT